MDDRARLELLFRPPGGGLLIVSTGGGYATPLHRSLYGTDDPARVTDEWRRSLDRLKTAKGVIVGVPSDIGAGVRRGASFGPLGIRRAFLGKWGHYPEGIVDLGDVPCIPQLLHDEMLTPAQREASSRALHGEANASLPASALSIAEDALQTIARLRPDLPVFVLGGDHSVSWPAILWGHKRFGEDLGVLHFDAHTDLLEYRYGVKYCFATWAFHAVQLLKPQHVVQVGVRTSGRTKEYWEGKLPVRQFWADEILADPEVAIANIVAHFAEQKPRAIYISNDIDGTDSEEAPATGTPETNGLSSEFVERLTAAVADRFPICGGDVTEVAPPLAGPGDMVTEKTCVLGARYLKTQIDLALRGPTKK